MYLPFELAPPTLIPFNIPKKNKRQAAMQSRLGSYSCVNSLTHKGFTEPFFQLSISSFLLCMFVFSPGSYNFVPYPFNF